MPSVNIPAPVRFGLYVLSAVGSLVVIYAIQKDWAGDAEYQLWTGFSALLAALAASKTPVGDQTDEAGQFENIGGAVVTVLVVIVLVLVILRLA